MAAGARSRKPGDPHVSFLFVPIRQPLASEAAQLELQGPAPYSPQGATDTATLLHDGLAALDLRAGDRVVFARDRSPAFGDLAVLREGVEAPLSLWKVYPEDERLRLSDGVKQRAAAEGTQVEGIVLAVIRRFVRAPD
jgi:hypothetical protein